MTIEEMKKALETRQSKERVVHVDDYIITVRLGFAFDEVAKAAEELYQQTLLIDDETLCMYDIYCKEIFEFYTFIKYFTNFDVSEILTVDDKVVLFDYLYPYLGDSCECHDGMWLIRKMSDRMSDSAKTLYHGRNSIVNKLSVMAKDMDINEDWIAEFAKSREVNQEMVNMIGTYQKTKEREEKAKPTIGGNVVGLDQFGKKG